jgi:hypothetical protein
MQRWVNANEHNDEWRLFVRDDSISINWVAKTDQQLSLY